MLADAPERWSALGFAVADARCQVGRVRLRFAGPAAGRGIVRWALRTIATAADATAASTTTASTLAASTLAASTTTELDGLPTVRTDSSLPAPAPAHPNGVLAIDHLVAMSPALDRTVAALQAAGLELRRIREQPTPAGAPRQAFFRLGAEILEVVQEPAAAIDREGGSERPARLWGLALTVDDLDRTVARLGPHVGTIRPAVQPGRRIATVRRSAGLAVPVALMSARVDPDRGI